MVSGDNGTRTLWERHPRDRPSDVYENRQSHAHADLLGGADKTGSDPLIPIGDASCGGHGDADEGKSYADAGNQHGREEDGDVVAFGRGSQEQEHSRPQHKRSESDQGSGPQLRRNPCPDIGDDHDQYRLGQPGKTCLHR